MVGVEKQDSLRFIRRLVGVEYVQMDLWQNGRGDLFISLQTTEDDELLVATTDENLLDFFDNTITLAKLVNLSPSPFGLLVNAQKESAVYLPDARLQIRGGHLRYSQIRNKENGLTINHSCTGRPPGRFPVHVKKFYWVWSKG